MDLLFPHPTSFPIQDLISPLMAEEQAIERLLAAHETGNLKKILQAVSELVETRRETLLAADLLETDKA